MLIREYIENINNKIKEIFVEDVKQEESIFDEYDKENGYDDIDDHSQNDIYDSYLNILNNIIDFSVNERFNSLKDCLDTNIIDLLDYIKFRIDKKDYADA